MKNKSRESNKVSSRVRIIESNTGINLVTEQQAVVNLGIIRINKRVSSRRSRVNNSRGCSNICSRK